MNEVTVIIPVYGVEKYLERCVESILTQSFSEFQIILVDDGSLDQSGMICDEYALSDPRVSIIHQTNAGVSAARNKALEICNSQYVAFCDSDDYWASDWLGELYRTITAAAADMVCADIQVVTEKGELIKKKNYEKGSYLICNKSDQIDFLIHQILESRLGWAVYSRLFKTEIIRAHHIRFCETCDNYAEDLCFTLDYSLFCRQVETCDASGYYYVQHQNSKMAKSLDTKKYDAVNEVSKQFGKHFFACTDRALAQKVFPVMHYLIFHPEYYKTFEAGKGSIHHSDLHKIADYAWYRHWTMKIFSSMDTFRYYLGDRNTRYAIRDSLVCLYELWWLYKLHRKGKQVIKRVLQ